MNPVMGLVRILMAESRGEYLDTLQSIVTTSKQ